MKHIENIFVVLMLIGFCDHGRAQQNNNMKQKNIITEDIHFAVGGQKCSQKAMQIPITSSEEKLLKLLDKKGISLKDITGRNLGGVTHMDCSEIKIWKSIPEYKATRVYRITEELIVVFKEVKSSELILVTFMGNDDQEIKQLKEELELNLLENSEAEKLKLFGDESRVTERIRLILDAKILTFTPKFPYHHYFVVDSDSNIIKSDIGAKEKAFFLSNRKYDLALIFDFYSILKFEN